MDSQDCPTDVKLHSCLKDEDDDVGLLAHFVKGLHAEIMDSVKERMGDSSLKRIIASSRRF